MNRAAQLQEIEQPKDLYQLAQNLLEEWRGDSEKVAHQLLALVQADEALLKQMVRSYLSSVGRRERQVDRQAIRSVETYGATAASATAAQIKAGAQRVVALAKGNMKMFLDWWLPDGTRMRDATRPQLRKCGETQYRQATTMKIDAKWYTMVASKLPDDKTKVGKALDEAALKKLREKAAHAYR